MAHTVYSNQMADIRAEVKLMISHNTSSPTDIYGKPGLKYMRAYT